MRHLTVLALFLLAACASVPEPRYYLLEGAEPSATPSAAEGAAVSSRALPAIGLREISLPLYARRPQISSQDAAGVLAASDAHRWAEDPARAATRLVSRIIQRMGGGEVYAEPWPLGAEPDLIVSIEVDQFIGRLGGETRLEGEFVLSRAKARGTARTVPFALRTAASGEDHAALASAYAEALSALAASIVAEAGR